MCLTDTVSRGGWGAYGEALSFGGKGFFEALLVFSYLATTVCIVFNMMVAVVVEATSTSARALQHDEVLQKIQSATDGTAAALVDLQSKIISSSSSHTRTAMPTFSSPSIKGRSRRSSISDLGSDPLSPMLLSATRSEKDPPAVTSLPSAFSSAAANASASKSDNETVLRRIGPWREMQSADGDVYYWNKFTGVVTWTHPKDLQPDAQNPGVTSVAAALHRMQAKSMKQQFDTDAVSEMLATAAMMRQVPVVRSPAELSYAASADDEDAIKFNGDSSAREDEDEGAAQHYAAKQLPSGSLAYRTTGRDDTQAAAGPDSSSSIMKKKLSAIQQWSVVFMSRDTRIFACDVLNFCRHQRHDALHDIKQQQQQQQEQLEHEAGNYPALCFTKRLLNHHRATTSHLAVADVAHLTSSLANRKKKLGAQPQ